MSVSISGNSEMVEFDQKKLDLVRNTFCKDATQEEFEVFIEICKSTQLNPLFKQIYFIKRGGKPTHQTSIDGLRLIADRTKRYSPGREPTYAYDKAGKLFSATSYVKKLTNDGTWHEVGATALFSEYNAGTGQWPKMPCTMLSKCAEALALRRAFPSDMLGLYTRDEMGQAEHDNDPVVRENRTTQIIEEPISTEEAHELENLLASEDKQYRDDILNYVSQQRKMEIPMKNFFSMPKRFLAGILKSIHNRKNEKKQEVKDDADAEGLF